MSASVQRCKESCGERLGRNPYAHPSKKQKSVAILFMGLAGIDFFVMVVSIQPFKNSLNYTELRVYEHPTRLFGTTIICESPLLLPVVPSRLRYEGVAVLYLDCREEKGKGRERDSCWCAHNTQTNSLPLNEINRGLFSVKL